MKKSTLGQVIRVIGFLSIIGGFILGINLGIREESMGYFSHTVKDYPIIFGFIISGIFSFIFCLALARCTDAATCYLAEKLDGDIK